MWERMRSESTKYYGAQKKLLPADLTGNPREEDLKRCAQLAYSKGSAAMSHLYDFFRNKKYFTGNPFMFVEKCRFPARSTQLIRAEGKDDPDGVDGASLVKHERPDGVKCAKARKQKTKKRKGKDQNEK